VLETARCVILMCSFHLCGRQLDVEVPVQVTTKVVPEELVFSPVSRRILRGWVPKWHLHLTVTRLTLWLIVSCTHLTELRNDRYALWNGVQDVRLIRLWTNANRTGQFGRCVYAIFAFDISVYYSFMTVNFL